MTTRLPYQTIEALTDAQRNFEVLSTVTTNSNALITALQATAPKPGDLKLSAAAVATGWLVCDGSAVSRTTYAALFAAINVNFGAGDGSTTFNIPDYRGRVPVGTGTGPGLTARALGDVGGEETHVISAGEMPVHTHTVTDPGHTHTLTEQINATGPAVGGRLMAIQGPDVTGSSTTGISLGNAGSGTAHNNMQPFVGINYLIKT